MMKIVHHTLETLAINVGVKQTVIAEVVDLVDIVAADLISNADLVPLPAIEGKFTFGDDGITDSGNG